MPVLGAKANGDVAKLRCECPQDTAEVRPNGGNRIRNAGFVKKNLARAWYGSCSPAVIAKPLCSQ